MPKNKLLEIELKFQIPTSKRKALAREIQRYQPELLNLQAKYFDTADEYLQQKHISLRQRQENEMWRQTLKAPKNALERIEIESEIRAQDAGSIDLKPYMQHKNLRALLAPAAHSPLILQFETQIQRQRFTHSQNDSQIEIALDQGVICANNSTLDVCEIEFELKQGAIEDLIESIRPWVKKYRIWLDSSSKAQKGQWLKQNAETMPVQHQSELQLDPHDSSQRILQKIVANCLEHLLPNASAIALKRNQAEHVHQARVSIRRLRSALKTFSFDPQYNSKAAQWQPQLADIFRQFGNSRDRDALSESLMPKLEAAGSPILQLPASTEGPEGLSAIFHNPATVLLLLELIEFIHSTPQKNYKAQKQLKKKLNKMHTRICQAAGHFEQMHAEEKHQLRKRVKTLRYSVEFVSSLYDQKAVRSYLKALKPLQESLGQFNDLTVAQEIFQSQLEQQPKAWFILGWIASQHTQIAQSIQLELRHFVDNAKPFWQD